MKHLDLFSGIGGFALAASWVWGDEHEIVSFCEPNKQCKEVLNRAWPKTPIHNDIRTLNNNYGSIDIICGGDPCPCRSKARAIHTKTRHPDLSGHFLSVIGRYRPEWVVRENVPASDVIDFECGLAVLGYSSVIVATNSYPYTGQNREREIIVGCIEKAKMWAFIKSFERQGRKGNNSTQRKKKDGYPCLTTRGSRYDARDGYIFDGSTFRIADCDERRKLAGFPEGWLDGLSKTAVERVTGNAIVPQVAEVIMRAIKKVDQEVLPLNERNNK